MPCSRKLRAKTTASTANDEAHSDAGLVRYERLGSEPDFVSTYGVMLPKSTIERFPSRFSVAYNFPLHTTDTVFATPPLVGTAYDSEKVPLILNDSTGFPSAYLLKRQLDELLAAPRTTTFISPAQPAAAVTMRASINNCFMDSRPSCIDQISTCFHPQIYQQQPPTSQN